MGAGEVSRRGFVGAVGVGSAALVAGQVRAAGAEGANDKVRLGLIGAGSRGNQLLDTFLAAERRRDRRRRRRRRQARRRDRRADQEGEAATTPDDRARLPRDARRQGRRRRHHRHARPLARPARRSTPCMAGKDVYVEKPVAHNVAEGQAMIKAARKYDKIMAVGTQQRSSTHFQKAVEIVRSGKLGKVFWVQTWNFENISPVGMGRYPDSDAAVARRLRPLARPRARAAVQPEPVPPALPLVLRLRRRHDERLGRPPQRHRPLGARRQGPARPSPPPAASSPPTTTATRPTPCRSSTSSPAARSPTRCARGTA